MGMNPGLLDIIGDWCRGWGIGAGDAVLDIGTSQLFCEDDPGSLNRFLRHLNAEPFGDAQLKRLSKRGFAAELFQRAGLVYEAIDITAYPHTLRLDLNQNSLPYRRRGRYALVINSGTTEHVVNQLNAFKIIHDAARVPNGLMYHNVPMCGDFSHGLFNYNPRFFTRLADANDYEIERRWIWAADERREYQEVELAFVNRPFEAQDAWVNFLLRRRNSQGFRVPVDNVGWPPAA